MPPAPPSVPFSTLLYSPNRLPYLVDFLVGCGAADLLMFWLEVEQFTEFAGSENDYWDCATRIHDRFLLASGGGGGGGGGVGGERVRGGEGGGRSSGSAWLADATYCLVMEKLEARNEPSVGLFDQAQREVRAFMEAEWYPTFLESRAYQGLLDWCREMAGPPQLDKLCGEGEGGGGDANGGRGATADVRDGRGAAVDVSDGRHTTDVSDVRGTPPDTKASPEGGDPHAPHVLFSLYLDSSEQRPAYNLYHALRQALRADAAYAARYVTCHTVTM